jgi:hypothetical protein
MQDRSISEAGCFGWGASMTDEMTSKSKANFRLPASIIAPKNVTAIASHNIHDIISSQEGEEEEEVVVAVAECPTIAGHNDRRL